MEIGIFVTPGTKFKQTFFECCGVVVFNPEFIYNLLHKPYLDD